MYNYSAELNSLQNKFSFIEDRVRKVVSGLDTSFFLYGPGGTGKTHSVTKELDRLEANWVLLNSFLTAAGLFDYLEEHQDDVIVLDDMEQLFHERAAVGFLRSATWGERRVTKTTSRQRREFNFKGGIIILSNLPLGNSSILDALATRMNPAEFNPTKQEKLAMMWQIAQNGKKDLPPDSCMEVFEFFRDLTRTMENSMFNLRLFEQALNTRISYEKKITKNHWKLQVTLQTYGRISNTQFSN